MTRKERIEAIMVRAAATSEKTFRGFPLQTYELEDLYQYAEGIVDFIDARARPGPTH